MIQWWSDVAGIKIRTALLPYANSEDSQSSIHSPGKNPSLHKHKSHETLNNSTVNLNFQLPIMLCLRLLDKVALSYNNVSAIISS